MAEMARMTAAQLADKLMSTEHADIVRESVAWMAAELMEAEVGAKIGAEHGERVPDRTTHRNGYRPRAWDTRVGGIELAIPRLRQGSYFPASWSRAAVRSRHWSQWCRRRTSTV